MRRGIAFERDAVNLETLDADLRAAFGDTIVGVSLDDVGEVTRGRVLVAGDWTPEDEARLTDLLAAHDPSVVSAGEQKRARRDAARVTLAAMIDALDLSEPLTNDPKLARLEKAVRLLLAERRD